MKKTLLGLIVVSFLLGAVPAFSYVIDGNLNDWGVTPFTDWTPNGTADFIQENNTNRPPSDPFNELYDIEAMYFDDDADYFYFGVVSSNDYNGDWASEDIGIDLNNDGAFEYGLDAANVPVNQGKNKGVYTVNSWEKIRGINYKIKNGTQIGTYEIFNRYLGKIEPGVHSWEAKTYVLEGRISRLLFGDIACGQAIRLMFARVTCLKDWISLSATCNGNCGGGVVPEPTTLLLFGSSFLGLVGLKSQMRLGFFARIRAKKV